MIFFLGLIFGGVLSIFITLIRIIYFISLIFYFLIILITSIFQNYKRAYLIFPGIILTHLGYGLGSLYGIIIQKK